MFFDSDSYILDTDKVNQLFVVYRKIDVLLAKHRRGIDVIDVRNIESLKEKRCHYREVMVTLDLLNAYEAWLKELGIE